jgi:rhodanese-related sulfurtransferase
MVFAAQKTVEECSRYERRSGKEISIMDVSRITVTEVNEQLQRGEKVALIDARSPQAWGEAGTKAPGAVRVPPNAVEKHLANIGRDRTVVVYCT